MENQNLNILDEINKGSTMGMDAISFVSEKVTDSKFKEILDGLHDDIPESAFLFVGTIEEAVEKAKTLG